MHVFFVLFWGYMGRFAPKIFDFYFRKKSLGKRKQREKVKQTKCGSLKGNLSVR